MDEETILKETAKLAKEKGFDKIVDWFFNENNKSNTLYPNINGLKHSDGNNGLLSAPTQSILQKWLREEHQILLWVEPITNNRWEFGINYPNGGFGDAKEYDTFEAALEIGLQEALKLIK